MSNEKQRGYCCIGLDNPKTAVNIGGVLRAAGCYGASAVFVSGTRYKNNRADTQKAWRHLPFFEIENFSKDCFPKDCIGVAVDLVEGARPLPNYIHPERAIYFFGAEDRTLGEDVLKLCRDKVYIPMSYCMNLAACVNVVLYDRLAKNSKNKIKLYSKNNV